MEMLPLILGFIYPYMILAIMTMGRLWACDFSELYEGHHTFKKISSVLSIVVKCLLILSLVSGVAVFMTVGFVNGLLDIYHWVTSFISFRPNMNLVAGLPVLTKIHMIILFTFIFMLSFIRPGRKQFTLIKPHNIKCWIRTIIAIHFGYKKIKF